MKMKLLFLITIIFSFSFFINAQDESDSIEVYLIDSFVTPEVPHTFMLSFFTSAPTKSKVVIDKTYTYTVSDSLTESHKIDIDISDMNFKMKNVPYIIYVVDSSGHQYRSENYEFELPEEPKVQGGSNFLLLCLFGVVDFALPSPVYVKEKTEDYFSLTKEIPLVTIRGSGYGYPLGYFSVEYSHFFNAPVKNFLRV